MMTFIVYLSALQNDFVNWDDNSYVFENPNILSLNSSFFRWAFFDFYSDNWHPLTWISHAADYAIWGLNPLGHHLTNIIFHAANTFLVVLLVMRLLEIDIRPTGAYHDSRFTLIAAGVTGLLFGLHPVHVESVVWVAERKDLLCALFFLLSIAAYTKYVGAVGAIAQKISISPFLKKEYLLFFGFALFALLSKPMAVSLPAVFLILDWYPFRRVNYLKTWWAAVVEKLPIIILCLISSALTVMAQKAGGTIASISTIPLSARILVATKSLAAYLLKMVLPMHLVPYYPYPSNASMLSIEYLLATALVLVLTACFVLVVRTQRVWLSAWGYYLITLMPVIGIFQVGNQAMADRYTYLPSLGPFFIAGLSASWISGKINNAGEWRKGAKFLFISTGVFVLLFISYLTLVQIRIWKNDMTLWNYVIEKEPDRIFFAFNNRALAFSKRGHYDDAIIDFNRAIELDPTVGWLYNNRGLVFASQKMYDQATADFKKAIELNYDSGYYNMACLHSIRNNTEEACIWFEKMIQMGYDNWEHIRQDNDFDNIRNVSCYKKIMVRK